MSGAVFAAWVAAAAVLAALGGRLSTALVSKPVTLTLGVLALVIGGLWAGRTLPLELDPEKEARILSIWVDLRGGMPPPEVEARVTRPIEEALAGIAGLRDMISSSKKDRAVVTLFFRPGVPLDWAALEAREKFLRVRPNLPADTEKPVIARCGEGDAPIYIAGLLSRQRSAEELRALADRFLKEKLQRMEGVANVEVRGGRERKVLVDLDREKCAALGLPIERVVSALERNNLSLRLGEVGSGDGRLYGVRARGLFRDAADLAQIAVPLSRAPGPGAPNFTWARLRDVAEVRDGYLEPESAARCNGRQAVAIFVQKESGANTLELAGRLEQALDAFRAGLPADVELVALSDPRPQILKEFLRFGWTLIWGTALAAIGGAFFWSRSRLARRSAGLLATLLAALWIAVEIFGGSRIWLGAEGVLLAGTCPLWFFRDSGWRRALALAAMVPVQVSATLLGMRAAGVPLNSGTAPSLLLGIVALLDFSATALEEKRGGLAVLLACLTPLGLAAESTRAFFRPAAFTILLAASSAFAISLILFPAMVSLFESFRKPGESRPREGRISPLLRLLSKARIPKAALRWAASLGAEKISVCGILLGAAALRRICPVSWTASAVFAGTSLFVLAGYAGLSGRPIFKKLFKNQLWIYIGIAVIFGLIVWEFVKVRPMDFLATAERGEFILFIELDSGARLDVTDRLVRAVESVLLEDPFVRSVVRQVSSRVEGWSAKIYVTLNEESRRRMPMGAIQGKLKPRIDAALRRARGDTNAFAYFSESGSGREIAVDLFGDDLDELALWAVRFAEAMDQVPGMEDLRIRHRPGQPQWSLRVDRARAALAGLSVEAVARSLHAQMRGLRATALWGNAEEVETVVRLRPDQRQTADQLAGLLIQGPGPRPVPLSEIAFLEPDQGPSEIWRRNRRRTIQISANLNGLTLGEAADRAREILRRTNLPPGIYGGVSEDAEAEGNAVRETRGLLLLSAFLSFAVLAALLESFPQAFAVLGSGTLGWVGTLGLLSGFAQGPAPALWVGLLFAFVISARQALGILHFKEFAAAPAALSLAMVLPAVLASNAGALAMNGLGLAVALGTLASLPAAFYGIPWIRNHSAAARGSWIGRPRVLKFQPEVDP